MDGLIHGIGILASLGGVPLLILLTMSRREPLPIITASIYGVTLVAALAISGAYNLLSDARMKERLRPYDHAAIFLLIAGTYTPFSLITIGGALGWALCMSVWLAAIAGAALKFLHRRRYERLFIYLYIALGWAGVPALGIVMIALPTSAFLLLVVGGVFYTAGVAFHLRDAVPYSTAVWHGFVLIAAACHYLAVLQALAPRKSVV